jgi:hypothetical protein
MSEPTTTPAPEVKGPETTVQTTPEVVAAPAETAPKAEPTVAQMLGDKKAEQVPIARLNKEIQRKKELEDKVRELETKLAEGTKTQTQVSSSLRELAAEHNIDPDFLDKFAKTIKAEAESEIEEKLRPLTEKGAREARDKAFETHFAKALESMPEFKEVVNPSVIKQMAMNPDNSEKTFSQLIEEAYGNTIQGKRSIENSTPRGGGKAQGLDLDRASKDTAYFKEVMADPELKRQYNEGITSRIRL